MRPGPLAVDGEKPWPLNTPTDLGAKAPHDIGGSMNAILADVFALYLKTTMRSTWTR
jgi:hypothetical protein